jgi:bisphosphoglycerate-independent phosphoglycerate mutase (AlkP superfamily)
MNRPSAHNHARMVDLAPTILKYLDASGYDNMEGKPLL